MRILTFLYLIFTLIGYPAVKSPLPDILDTYGGSDFVKANSRVELSGTAENRSGKQPFSLQISGGKSLLSTPDRIVARNGSLGQRAIIGEARSQARRTIHGTQDVFLIPSYFVSQLQSFQYEGRSEGLDWFAGEVLERRFLGYRPPAQTIRLGFDSESHLLLAAEMLDPVISGEPVVVRYFDYQVVAGVPFPLTINRTIGDRLLLRLTVDSVNWDPAFSDEVLDLVKGGI